MTNKVNLIKLLKVKQILRLSSFVLLCCAALLLIVGETKPFVVTLSIVDQATLINRVYMVKVLNLSVILAFSLLSSAAAYYVMSTSGYGAYLKDVTKGVAHWRWFISALSSSIISTMCLVMVGAAELALLLSNMLIICTLAGVAYVSEVLNERRKRPKEDALWVYLGTTFGYVCMFVLLAATYLSKGVKLAVLPLIALAIFVVYQLAVAVGMYFKDKLELFFKDASSSETYFILASVFSKIAITVVVFFYLKS